MTKQQNKRFIWGGVAGLFLAILLAGVTGLTGYFGFQNYAFVGLMKGIVYFLAFASFISMGWLGIMARIFTHHYGHHEPKAGYYWDQLQYLRMENRMRLFGLWVENPALSKSVGDKSSDSGNPETVAH